MLIALLIALTTWMLSLFMPWWSLSIPCLIFGGWLGKKAGHSFLFGFLGVGGLWLLQTLFIDIQNNGILTTRIAELFSLPSGYLVILLTIVIGGLAGGLSTLTGYLARKAFIPRLAVSDRE